MSRKALFLLTCIGCSGAPTAPKANGSLVVVIAAPTGVTPSVVVTGPKGYTMTLVTTDTLKNLAPGTYTIVADTSAVPDSVVGSIVSVGAVTGGPVTVSANMTSTASVTYRQSHRGGIWVANLVGTAIALYGAADLRSSGTPTPADTIGGIPNSTGVAIDASGNLWVASGQSNTLRMYTIAQRIGGGSPTPAVEITSASLRTPSQLAFDRNGTLWVADTTNGLVGVTKNQLSATGTVTATYTIADTGTSPGAKAVAFDAQGNAWVAGGQQGAPEIAEYAAAQLTVSGSPIPRTVIPSAQIPGAVYSLAFDSAASLWVGAFGNAYQYAAGSTTVTRTIPLLAGDASVLGIGFDHRGTMWVVQAEGNLESGLNGFPAAVLQTANPQPSIFVKAGPSIICPGQLAFDPFTPTS